MIYLVSNQTQLVDNETYSIISKEEARNILNCQPIIELDTETTGFSPFKNKLLTQQFGVPGVQIVIDNKTIDPIYFKDILEDRERLFILQNAKFDLRFFLALGIDIKNIYDTLLAECVLTTGIEDRELGLDALALKYCNKILDKSIRGNIYKEGLSDRVIKYCADDVTYLNEIRLAQLKEIERLELQEVLKLENEVVRVFAKMEYTGVKINKSKWLEVSNLTENTVLKLEKELDEFILTDSKLSKFRPKVIQTNLFGYEERQININWSSNQQKLQIIKSLGVNIDSVGDRELQRNKKQHPLIPKLIDYNKFAKLATAFGKSFLNFIEPSTQRVHYNIWQILNTGRISVSEPNLNQIPSKGELGKTIRSCFIPREGYKIVGGDFSGMELRIIAEFSGDEIWVNSFKNGEDLHSVLCSKTFDIDIKDVKKPTPFKPDITYRDVQKTINFGLAYGMSKFKLADTMQILVEKADEIIKKFFRIVPKVDRFLTYLGNLGKNRGYIRTGFPYRRIRWFPEWSKAIEESNFAILGEIERASKNTPIQGTNGDIIKKALIMTQEEIDTNNWPVYIILAVYDEIQTECREDVAEEWKNKLNEIMIKAAEISIKNVPIVVDCKVSDYWQK